MTSRFEKHPILTGVFLLLSFSIILIGTLEGFARFGLGLGKVVVYDSHPIYGFRPQPDQHVTRRGHTVEINSDSLRAHPDWNHTAADKRILFLGDSVTYGGSYIDNEQLFSRHAAEALNLIDGNAGVNAWGVLNVHALVNTMSFLPAATYVTVLPEGDFYRGLNRIGGQPFWTRQPQYALEEILYYGLYKLNLRMNGSFSLHALPLSEQHLIVNLAANKLKEMDALIKSKGYQHFIFITPSREQVKSEMDTDPFIQQALKKNQVNVHYLLDDVKKQDHVDSLFYDTIHLTEAGHAVWGALIARKIQVANV